MEDNMYIKPGNQERGWNDPPQFSYGLQTAQGPKRNLLNKRVPPPQLTGQSPGMSSPTPPVSNPLAPPPCGTTPPRPPQAHPPCSMATPPPPCVGGSTPPVGQVVKPQATGDSQSDTEPDVEEVVSVLNWALAACRHAVKGHVCDEVVKRVRVLEDSWRSGRLSLPVRKRMSNLAQELRSGHWDTADEIHRSLMVDHVTEVSQWLVGIKRLIAETRKLSPELLELGQKPEEPEQNPGEMSQSPEQAAEGSPCEITPSH